MAKSKDNEKRLEGDIPADLKGRIDDFLHDHPSVKKKHLIRAMAELWFVLSPEAQAEVLLRQWDRFMDRMKRHAAGDQELHQGFEERISRLEKLLDEKKE